MRGSKSQGWRGVIKGGGVDKGVKLLRLRTALHTLKLTPQNSFGESHT